MLQSLASKVVHDVAFRDAGEVKFDGGVPQYGKRQIAISDKIAQMHYVCVVQFATFVPPDFNPYTLIVCAEFVAGVGEAIVARQHP